MHKTARIRELNDAFRRTFTGGKVMLTAGVDALPDANKAVLLAKVRAFDAFDAGNDPHGEHDFAVVEHEGERYFAKSTMRRTCGTARKMPPTRTRPCAC